MNVLMPFPYLEIFDRFHAQLKAIADRVGKFYIAYTSGTPQRKWRKDFSFLKFMDYPYNPRQVGWKKNVYKLPFHVHRLAVSKRLISQFIDVDLCYSFASFWQSALTATLARKLSIPYVIRVRGRIRFMLAMSQQFIVKTFYTSYIHHNLKNAKLIIPINSQTKTDLVEWGFSMQKVSDPIGLGVDTQHFQPAKTNITKQITLGYAGRLSKEKGIVRLVELAQQLPKTKFLLVGRKQMSLKFPSNMKYLGRIPHEKMPEFYNSCDLIVLPSFTEGFPNVVVEAYACGKPILATPEAIPEQIKVFGYAKPFHHWKETLGNMDKHGLKIMGEYARRYVKENHTWERFGERMVKQFERLRS